MYKEMLKSEHKIYLTEKNYWARKKKSNNARPKVYLLPNYIEFSCSMRSLTLFPLKLVSDMYRHLACLVSSHLDSRHCRYESPAPLLQSGRRRRRKKNVFVIITISMIPFQTHHWKMKRSFYSIFPFLCIYPKSCYIKNRDFWMRRLHRPIPSRNDKIKKKKVVLKGDEWLHTLI